MLAKSHGETAPVRLGQSGEDYLEAVLVLGREKRAVRVKDIANRLGVSRPSVVAALAKLERQGMLRHEPYGAVELTEDGMRLARSVDRRHLLLFRFLHDTLGLPSGKASAEACALEHALSSETTARLLLLVGERGRRRPHKERTSRAG